MAVQVIAEKLLDYLRTATDEGQKAEVAKRIGELAERFAPDAQWFIDTMNKVSHQICITPSPVTSDVHLCMLSHATRIARGPQSFLQTLFFMPQRLIALYADL